MSAKTQLGCVYCCYVFIVLFFVGFALVAGFVPPPDPAADAQQIAEFFRDHTVRIRVGMFICLFASALLLPWGGAIAAQMRRAETASAPLTYTWIAAQGCIVIEFVYPCMIWASAVFRPEDDPERFQRANDLAWLLFLGIIETAIVQAFALGVLVLMDSREDPVFPRWFGYFQFWAAAGFAPTGFVLFTRQGPFAWNGLISWWIAISFAFAWLVVTTHVTGGAIKRQRVWVPSAGPDQDDTVARLAAVEARLGRLDGQRT
jgi:hypothetical protein